MPTLEQRKKWNKTYYQRHSAWKHKRDKVTQKFQLQEKSPRYILSLISQHSQKFDVFDGFFSQISQRLEPTYYEKNKEKIIEHTKKWKKNNPERVKEIVLKRHNKKRGLGFVPLNKPFNGADAHHVDRIHVVYIPRELHMSIRHNVWTGKSMKEINKKAFEWYNNQVGSIQMSLIFPNNEGEIHE